MLFDIWEWFSFFFFQTFEHFQCLERSGKFNSLWKINEKSIFTFFFVCLALWENESLPTKLKEIDHCRVSFVFRFNFSKKKTKIKIDLANQRVRRIVKNFVYTNSSPFFCIAGFLIIRDQSLHVACETSKSYFSFLQLFVRFDFFFFFFMGQSLYLLVEILLSIIKLR